MLKSRRGCWVGKDMTTTFFRLLSLALPLLAVPASAQVPLNLGLLVICAELKEDAQRLQCFDKLVADSLKAPTAPAAKGATNTQEQDWKITEAKSPVDDSPQMAAVLESVDGNGALIMRCHDKVSDAFIGTHTYVGSEPMRIIYRTNKDAPVDTRWLASKTGESVFVPSQIFFSFIRALPQDGELAVRLFDYQGRSIDFSFKLGPVAEVRDLLTAKCGWPAEPKPATAPATVPAAPSPRLAKSIVPAHAQQRWNVGTQRR